MRQFAQLGDFVIRYVSDPDCRLDETVGLSDLPDRFQYPQIVYIPDNPREFCEVDEFGNQRVDCTATEEELNEFQQNSFQMLRRLNNLNAPWPDS
jgi:hypothetical protein